MSISSRTQQEFYRLSIPHSVWSCEACRLPVPICMHWALGTYCRSSLQKCMCSGQAGTYDLAGWSPFDGDDCLWSNEISKSQDASTGFQAWCSCFLTHLECCILCLPSWNLVAACHHNTSAGHSPLQFATAAWSCLGCCDLPPCSNLLAHWPLRHACEHC